MAALFVCGMATHRKLNNSYAVGSSIAPMKSMVSVELSQLDKKNGRSPIIRNVRFGLAFMMPLSARMPPSRPQPRTHFL